MKARTTVLSPAALCLLAIVACIGYSIAASNASRFFTVQQHNKFAQAKALFPIQMKRWDPMLFYPLVLRVREEMSEFLKSAEHEADAHPQNSEAVFKPQAQTITFVEQFRVPTLVSYLEISILEEGETSPTVTFTPVNYDKALKREIQLGDILEGAEDRSKALEALAGYAREDLKDKTGEDEDSDALMELSKPDLSVYGRFTLCPSTKIGKAAGLTIHFPPDVHGPYAGAEFHVTVPYTVFAKFLKPGMKSLFAGEPRQAPVSWQNADT